MTGPQAPRSATAALRDLLEQFHGEPVKAKPGAFPRVGMAAHLSTVDVTDRLNELAALERREIEESKVRDELARVREQRDRAIDLADGIVRHAEDPGLTSGVLADMRRDVDRLRRLAHGLAADAATTVVRVMAAPSVILRHALELADERDGEDRWQRQARGLYQIGYRIVPKAGESS